MHLSGLWRLQLQTILIEISNFEHQKLFFFFICLGPLVIIEIKNFDLKIDNCQHIFTLFNSLW